MKKERWVWMPHAGHFILGHMCRFCLSTYVGKYIVSTVGEYVPDSAVRRINVQARGDKEPPIVDPGEFEYLKRYGFDEIGCGRTYETMVFKAKKAPKKVKCCPYIMISGTEQDFKGYNTAADAYEGHLRMCRKWSKK